jgi:UDP-N-acetylmuramoylalanine--D-glutamate ligase
VAAARLLSRDGAQVYASDSGSGDSAQRAVEALGEEGIEAVSGGHDLERIARAALLVVSPGVPPDAPPVAAARAAGVKVLSEVEVALHFLPGSRIIAVSGTNGKTTTTALIGHLLRALGEDAVDAGNIGRAITDVALGVPPDWLALELSSFQLHDTPSIAPEVGVITNISPDHLDRYGSVEEYYADKALLFRNASPASCWVLNADDPQTLALPARRPRAGDEGGLPGHLATFSLEDQSAAAWYDEENDALMVLGQRLIDRADLTLLGNHNVANALAAALAVMTASEQFRMPEARSRIAAGLRTFHALSHRLEVVGEFGGVLWINDSKATNVSSTRVALEGMTRPTVLLMGGRHKGEPYTSLGDAVERIARRVIAYGEAADLIVNDLGSVVEVEKLGSSFREVMERARELAEPGDAVLLSPACSSYDMFENYEERGASFMRLAREAKAQ